MMALRGMPWRVRSSEGLGGIARYAWLLACDPRKLWELAHATRKLEVLLARNRRLLECGARQYVDAGEPGVLSEELYSNRASELGCLRPCGRDSKRRELRDESLNTSCVFNVFPNGLLLTAGSGVDCYV